MKSTLLTFSTCLLVSVAQAAAVNNPWTPPSFCKAIKVIVDVLGPDPKATSFCSSFLHISTTTQTATSTVTPIATTTTSTITATADITVVTTTTITETATESSSTTITSTSTCTPAATSRGAIVKRGYPSVTTKTTSTQALYPTPSYLTKSASSVISSACSCLSIPTPSTTVTSTTTAPQQTISVTTFTTVSNTVTSTASTTVTETTTDISTSTATATFISTFSGQYVSSSGNVYNEYPNIDFFGGDIAYCSCGGNDTNCRLQGSGTGTPAVPTLGRCNSYTDCQDICDQYNAAANPASGRSCIGISYSTGGYKRCFLKYSYNGPANKNQPCGETYSDIRLDSALLQSAQQ